MTYTTRYLETRYANDPDSDVETVEQYYEERSETVYDVVGLDAEGDIRVVVEAERVTGEVQAGPLDDYEKMAAVDSDSAIWVMRSRSVGHTVLESLHGEFGELDESYAKTTPLEERQYTGAGLTDVCTVSKLLAKLEPGEGEASVRGNCGRFDGCPRT